MHGCATAFNVAGKNAFCLRDPSELYRVNVVGARTLVEAAARAGVERIVHTSSAATIGEAAGTVGSESSPHRGFFLSDYERSKFEGETAVLEAGERLDVDIVCVNPSSVQGPGRSGGTARIMILYLRGKMRYFVPTTLSLVDIDDCTTGHLLAAEKGTPGERYVLNGAALPLAEALEVISDLAGGLPRPRLLPGWVALAGGRVVEAIARARRRTAPVCGEMVRTLLHGHNYDGSRASSELGLEYTPIETTLVKTIAWLRAEGLVWATDAPPAPPPDPR